MTIIPKFSDLCHFARDFPTGVGELIEFGWNDGGKVREDTISDLFAASLTKSFSSNVVVLRPNELRTGSDFDIYVYSRRLNSHIMLRVQAKKLDIKRVDWEKCQYSHLLHPKKSGDQSRVLVSSSAHAKIPTYPVYAFYNPLSIYHVSLNNIKGLNLADARHIRSIIKFLILNPKSKYKHLKFISNFFFDLEYIFCPQIDSFGPESIYRNLSQNIETKNTIYKNIRTISQGSDGRLLLPRKLNSGDEIRGAQQRLQVEGAFPKWLSEIERFIGQYDTIKMPRSYKLPRPLIVISAPD